MKALIALTVLFIAVTLKAFAQPGQITGVVSEKDSLFGVPFTSVFLFKDSVLIQSVVSDLDGKFIFKNVSSGKYNVRATSVGYQAAEVTGVLLAEGKSLHLNITLIKYAELKEVLIVEYKIPLLDRGMTGMQRTMYSLAGVHTRGSRHGRQPDQNDEEYAHVEENRFHEVSRKPLSTFSIDVDAASYSNLRRHLLKGTMPPQDAVRIEEMINYFSYHYEEPTGENPFSILTETAFCPWNEKHLLVRIAIAGKKIPLENLPDNNLVFLIDVSGSMESPEKLPLVKRSLRLLVEQLRSNDRVAIVVYAGNAGVVLPSTKGDKKTAILAAIENLEAGGSTAGGEGIMLAYEIAKENYITSGNNRVILSTDGDFNVGISDNASLEKLITEKRELGIYLTVLGYGTGNYKDAKMELLADKGNGNYAYIDNALEANKVLVKEMGATLLTIAKDVKLQVEFNPKQVKAYRLIGYENRLLEDEDFNDDKKDAGELGAGSHVTALYELIPAGSEEEVSAIDPLKYQQTIQHETTPKNELLTIKFRYKDPKGSRSKLIEHPVLYSLNSSNQSSDDFRFAAAVACFGQLLTNSKFKGSADYDTVLELAKSAKGSDDAGYRAEFIQLVDLARTLSSQQKGTADMKE